MAQKTKTLTVTTWRKFINWLRDSLRKLPDSGDPLITLSDLAYFGGLLLCAYGVYRYRPELGFIVLGVLLMLTVKPLLYWFK